MKEERRKRVKAATIESKTTLIFPYQ